MNKPSRQAPEQPNKPVGSPPTKQRYYRKIIRIRAEDSPNVRLAHAQMQAGNRPSNTIILPGVLPYAEFKKRRETWDKIRQCIGLDAQFWEGAESMLFPLDWLMRSAQQAFKLGGLHRTAKGVGIDPGEGGDKTAWYAVDEWGVLDKVAKQTPDTSVIVPETIAFVRKWSADPKCVVFDRGGGGKQHADNMRAKGYAVRSVGFGEKMSLPIKRGQTAVKKREEIKEEKYTYKNLRAQMYYEARLLLDPNNYREEGIFAIPAEYEELVRQLVPIPLWYTEEGTIWLPPKRSRSDKIEKSEVTMESILGCSPDEADAFVLACHGMLHKPTKKRVGGIDIYT